MNELIQSNKSRTQLDAKHRVMVILWVASVSTIGLYYLVSLFVPGPETDDDQGHVINIVLTLLGIFLAIISFVIKQGFIKQAEESQAPALVQTGLIVSLALCDSVGVLGALSIIL